MTNRPYIEYWKLGKEDYWKKVQFFEDKFSEISFLKADDIWEIELDYLNALFEIGKYKKLLSIIDLYIEKALDLNRETFIALLVKKASCLYNNKEFGQAEILAEKIIAINPLNETAKSLLLNCIRRHNSPNYQLIRAACSFLLLITCSLVVVHWFLILPFYPELKMVSGIAIKSLITITITSLLFNEVFYRLRGIKQWKGQISKIINK